MTDAVVVPVEDAQVIADLVRIGCAAIAAYPLAATDAVHQMARDRRLRIGRSFLQEIDPEEAVA